MVVNFGTGHINIAQAPPPQGSGEARELVLVPRRFAGSSLGCLVVRGGEEAKENFC